MKFVILLILTIVTIKAFSQENECIKKPWWYNLAPGCEITDMSNLIGWPCYDEEDFILFFEDNFDNTSLDPNKWDIITGVPRDFSFSSQKAWHRAENVVVSDGTLKIVAQEHNPEILGTWTTSWNADGSILTAQTANFKYSTAEICTDEFFKYGRYETRCKLPNGKGFWPAFWTFGGPIWNEIDIFEIHGNDIDRFTCNIHHDYDLDGCSETCADNIDNYTDFSQWHTFTLNYLPTKIEWLIDGILVSERYKYFDVAGIGAECGTLGGVYFSLQAWPEGPMKLFLNMAIQSGDDAPDENTQFPSTYEVDYVRYYKLNIQECLNCPNEVTYSNINDLPASTNVADFIFASENVVVQSGQSVTFKAGKEIILDGLILEPGALFYAEIENCGDEYIPPSSFNVLGYNLIENYIIDKCIDPIFRVSFTGPTLYSYKIWTMDGSLVCDNWSVYSSNNVDIWDASQAAAGWYWVERQFWNCDLYDFLQYNIYVTSSCNKSLSNTKSIEVTNPNWDLRVFPNPTEDIIYIDMTDLDLNEIERIFICDQLGRNIFETYNIEEKFSLSLLNYDSGIYTMHIQLKTSIISLKINKI